MKDNDAYNFGKLKSPTNSVIHGLVSVFSFYIGAKIMLPIMIERLLYRGLKFL